MSRTAEKVLAMLGSVFVVLGLVISLLLVVSAQAMNGDPSLQESVKMSIVQDTSNGLTGPEFDYLVSWTNDYAIYFYLFASSMIISLLFVILAYRQLSVTEIPKRSAHFFIAAGIFSGIVAFPSILFYVAAVFIYAKRPEDMIEEA